MSRPSACVGARRTDQVARRVLALRERFHQEGSLVLGLLDVVRVVAVAKLGRGRDADRAVHLPQQGVKPRAQGRVRRVLLQDLAHERLDQRSVAVPDRDRSSGLTVGGRGSREGGVERTAYADGA